MPRRVRSNLITKSPRCSPSLPSPPPPSFPLGEAAS